MPWREGDFEWDEVHERMTVRIDDELEITFRLDGDGGWAIDSVDGIDVEELPDLEGLHAELTEIYDRLEGVEAPERPPDGDEGESEDPGEVDEDAAGASSVAWDDVQEAWAEYQEAREAYDQAVQDYQGAMDDVAGYVSDYESARSDAESLADDYAHAVDDFEELAEAMEDAGDAASDALDSLPDLHDPLERLESEFDPESAPGTGGQVSTPWSHAETGGDPVNLFSGAFLHYATDLFLPGVGFDLELTRSYANQSYCRGIFGFKWTCWLDATIRRVSSGAVYIWFGNGSGAFLVPRDDGDGYHDEERYGVRVEYTGGRYSLVDLAGRVQRFDADGRIVEVEDRFGNQLVVERDGDGRPTRVLNGPRWFALRYDSRDRVEEVEDHGGRVWSYHYSDDELVKVTAPPVSEQPTGIRTEYEYRSTGDVRTHHNLATVLDHDGNAVLEMVYGTSGSDFNRVVEQVVAGDRITFAYEAPGADLTSDAWSRDLVTHATTTTDARGIRSRVEFNPYGQPRVKSRASGSVTRMSYHANGNLEEVEFPRGEVVRFSYDDENDDPLRHVLVTEIRRIARPATGLADLVSTCGYGPYGVRSWVIEESGERVDFTVDVDGLITSIVYPTVTLADGTSHVPRVTMGWTSTGQLERLVDAEGNETVITFYGAGFAQGFRETLSVNGRVEYAYTYDDHGRLIELEDAAGDAIRFGWDAANRRTSVTWSAAPGHEHRITHDPAGNVLTRSVRHVLPDGTVGAPEWYTETWERDRRGRPVAHRVDTEAGEAVTSFTWLSTGELESVTDPEGLVYRNEYDERGLRIAQIVAPGTPDEIRIDTTWDANGEPISFRSATGEETLEYDGHGRLARHVYADGRSSELHWDGGSRLTRLEGYQGVVLAWADDFELDEMGRPRLQRHHVFGAAGATGEIVETSVIYDRLGRPVTVASADGSTAFAYDDRHRVTSIADALGNRVELSRTATGLVDQVLRLAVDDSGATRRVLAQFLAYDAMGRLAATEDALGNRTEYRYDSLGRQVERIAADGSTERFTYGLGGELTAWTREHRDADGTVLAPLSESYVHDRAGELVAYVDPMGRRTTVHRTARGDIEAIERPDGVMAWTWTYDANGLIGSVTDARGVTTTYTYDPCGRSLGLTIIGLPSSPAVETFRTWTLDARGNPERAENDFGTVELEVDSLGRTIVETTESWTLEMTWNGRGVPDRVTYGSGLVLGYSWDAASRLRSLTIEAEGTDFQGASGVTPLVDVTPVGSEGQERVDRAGGAVVEAWFDAAGRVVRYSHSAQPDRALLFGPGSCLRVLTTPGADQTVHTYDSVGQLRGASVVAGATPDVSDWLATGDATDPRPAGDQTGIDAAIAALAPMTDDETWTYDPAGNRLTASDASGTSTFSIDDLDRIERADSLTYGWDDAGNLVDDGARTYVYDAWNRLIEIRRGADVEVSIQYDALGRASRVERAGERFVLRYLGPSVAEVYRDDRLVASAAHGFAIDRPVALLANGRTCFVDTDGVGSPVVLADHDGVELGSWERSPFGAIRSSSGDPDVQQALFPFLGFQGRMDLTDDIVDFRSRAYHVDLGRFLQPDPAGLWGGSNPYLFAGNNPATLQDPMGDVVPLVVTMGAGAVVGGVIGGASAWMAGGSATDILVHSATGALGGAIMGSGLGAVGLIAGGALGAGLSGAYEGRKAAGWEGAAIGGTVGAASGAVGGALAGPIANRIATPIAGSVSAQVVAWGGARVAVQGATRRATQWSVHPATRWLASRGVSHHTAGYVIGSTAGIGVGGAIEGGIEGSLNGSGTGFGLAMARGEGLGSAAWSGLSGSFTGGLFGSVGGGAGSIGFRGVSGVGFSLYAVRGDARMTTPRWNKFFGNEGEWMTQNALGSPLHGGRMPGSSSAREPDLWETRGLYGDVKNVQGMSASMWRAGSQFDQIAREIASLGQRMTIFHRPGVRATRGFQNAAERILGAGNLDMLPIPMMAFQPPVSGSWVC